jgi:hypothetical protein
MCGVSVKLEFEDPYGYTICIESVEKKLKSKMKVSKNTFNYRETDVFLRIYSVS